MFRYYTAIIFLNLFAMLIVQISVTNSMTLRREKKKLFHMLFAMIFIASLCEWIGNYLQGAGSSTRVIHIIVKAIELSAAPSIAFFVAWIIKDGKRMPAYIYLIVHSVIEVISGFTGFVYYVDKDSTYTHESFYWIYIVVYILAMVYCICVVLRNVKRYQYNGVVYFLLVVALMITGIVIQLYDSNLKVDYATLAIASIMLYVFTLEMIQQTDELTELINRRGYENYISNIEGDCAIIFLDVNKFKEINDTYGHGTGDEVLAIIGKTIKSNYARYGRCFRFGGDEFCVILNRNLHHVERLNGKFAEALNKQRDKKKLLPTVSTGYAYFNPKEGTIEDAVAAADQMMYKNKEMMHDM